MNNTQMKEFENFMKIYQIFAFHYLDLILIEDFYKLRMINFILTCKQYLNHKIKHLVVMQDIIYIS